MKKLLRRSNTPLDTNIVFLHKLLIAGMLVVFAYCKYAQVERQSPSCSGSGTIDLKHQRKLRLCITTAAFVEHEGQKKYTNGFGLYLPGVLFIVASLFLIPLKYQEFYEEEELVELFKRAQRLPRSAAIRNIDVIMSYSYHMMSKRVRLSYQCLEVDFFSLIILDMISSTNLFSKIIVGVITEGWDYVMDVWRLTYPTNVKCEIGPQMVYSASNTKHYRCTIPHNEIFKYIWTVAAIILLISMLLSLISLVYHMLQMLPFRRRKFLRGIVEIDKDTMDTLVKELPGGNDSLFLLRSYLIRLPCKELRKGVVTELMKIIKETSW
ncbi:uncharacterized protein LOC126987650 [Eriocheir sinensis]|uniref:uncharacterized protein LOC126987650 n=1 Tax=Eriocheir sinensis TaxID=95602 RepID=UPI0021CA63CD|nr:uncharacterized protein LOC126987650 [Eriocheir sinensis]XP_050700732.1 uncharacterized protein LOC126987650 [Eriocheir sinensis]XP_050700733.1 uncharacterized protein LOC126987650 [Eriocheir sinensis]XP_050700734.1 uncharacterized protein LOC126987650 [Eriocheir sinensis]XP_050700735.1 uncharacterized protein LOC126987650 [Eriocheir sinensis]